MNLSCLFDMKKSHTHTQSGIRTALCVIRGDRCHCVTADPLCTVRQHRPSGHFFTAENTSVHVASVMPTETPARARLFYIHASVRASACLSGSAFCYAFLVLHPESSCWKVECIRNVLFISDTHRACFSPSTCQPPASSAPYLISPIL